MLSESYVEALEEAAWAAAEARHGDEARRQRVVREAILALSSAYIEGRSTRTPDHELARLVFFTLADLPKIAYPLAELERSGRLPAGPLRILDVGAGCGTLTLGALGALPDVAVEHVWGVDADGQALDDFRRLYASVGSRRRGTTGPLRTRTVDLSQRRPLPADLQGPFSLIFVGSVLTELPPGARQPLLEGLLRKLGDDGALIVVEPALSHCARALHELRDGLLERRRCRVFAPCTHEAPCPLRDDPKAWCHEIRIWSSPPPRLRKLAAACGLRRRDLKFSYLTLLPRGAVASVAEPTPRAARGPAYRVVGSLQRSKGRRSVALCGGGARHELLRLERHREASNRPFERANRGVVLWLPDAPEGAQGALRIKAGEAAVVVDPAREPGDDAGDEP